MSDEWIEIPYYGQRLTDEDVALLLYFGRYKHKAPEFFDCLRRFAGEELYRRRMMADGANPRECRLMMLPLDLPREEIGVVLTMLDSWLSHSDGSEAFFDFLSQVNSAMLGFARAELDPN